MTDQDRMIRKAQPTQSAVHTDRPLTNVSLAILQDPSAFVADQVFPQIPSSKQSDLYREYPRGAFNRDQMVKRAAGAQTAGVGYETSTTPFFCDVFGLHVDIDEQTEQNADEEVDLDFEATTLLSHQALINRDRRWAAEFFITGVWTNEETLAAMDKWSDFTNSSPLAKVEEKKVEMGGDTGLEPNTLILGREVWQQLRNHPELVGRLDRGQTSGPASVLLQSVANLMELDRIIVARSIFNSAAEGATDVHSYIFGKNALLLYVPDSPGRYTPASGYTFTWSGMSGGNVAGTRIKRFEMLPEASRRVEIESAYDQKVISADLGSMLLAAVA